MSFFTRRTFLKTVAAIGTSTAAIDCGSSSEDDYTPGRQPNMTIPGLPALQISITI